MPCSISICVCFCVLNLQELGLLDSTGSWEFEEDLQPTWTPSPSRFGRPTDPLDTGAGHAISLVHGMRRERQGLCEGQ